MVLTYSQQLVLILIPSMGCWEISEVLVGMVVVDYTTLWEQQDLSVWCDVTQHQLMATVCLCMNGLLWNQKTEVTLWIRFFSLLLLPYSAPELSFRDHVLCNTKFWVFRPIHVLYYYCGQRAGLVTVWPWITAGDCIECFICMKKYLHVNYKWANASVHLYCKHNCNVTNRSV